MVFSKGGQESSQANQCSRQPHKLKKEWGSKGENVLLSPFCEGRFQAKVGESSTEIRIQHPGLFHPSEFPPAMGDFIP